jgi:thiol peroxidase
LRRQIQVDSQAISTDRKERIMPERTGAITLRGKACTLIGHEVKAGDKAPEVSVTDNEMKPLSLSSFRGRTLVLLAVPSLDTPVCDAEVKHFNREAAKLGDDVQFLTVSMDLPFAQKRWLAEAGVSNVMTASDYKGAALGNNFGVLIKELHLLARAVFVIDKEGVVRYVQLVREVSDEPYYDEVIAAVRKAA